MRSVYGGDRMLGAGSRGPVHSTETGTTSFSKSRGAGFRFKNCNADVSKWPGLPLLPPTSPVAGPSKSPGSGLEPGLSQTADRPKVADGSKTRAITVFPDDDDDEDNADGDDSRVIKHANGRFLLFNQDSTRLHCESFYVPPSSEVETTCYQRCSVPTCGAITKMTLDHGANTAILRHNHPYVPSPADAEYSTPKFPSKG